MTKLKALDSLRRRRAVERAARSRRNGSRSRGPVTPAGKLASSRNATAHGVYARVNYLALAVYQQSLAAYTQQFHPASPVESDCVEQLAQARCDTDRFRKLQDEIFTNPHWITDPTLLRTFTALDRASGAAFRRYHKTLAVLLKLHSADHGQFSETNLNTIQLTDSIEDPELTPDLHPEPAPSRTAAAPASASRPNFAISTPTPDASPDFDKTNLNPTQAAESTSLPNPTINRLCVSAPTREQLFYAAAGNLLSLCHGLADPLPTDPQDVTEFSITSHPGPTSVRLTTWLNEIVTQLEANNRVCFAMRTPEIKQKRAHSNIRTIAHDPAVHRPFTRRRVTASKLTETPTGWRADLTLEPAAA